MKVDRRPWIHESASAGVERLTYQSPLDGTLDWALASHPSRAAGPWIEHLHGHGSTGDQLYTRADIRAMWLLRYRALGFGVLSPNLRGNAWMCPEAAEDLHLLLNWVRHEYGVKAFYFVSGSMGGTGNLIYAMLHPEDVTAAVALCSVTDIGGYHEWCCGHPGGVRDEIRLAVESAYKGRPDQVSDRYSGHSVMRHADRLTMPLFLSHATGDDVIPVEQSRDLCRRLSTAKNVTYVEIEGGDHDSPLHKSGVLEWLESRVAGDGRFSG